MHPWDLFGSLLCRSIRTGKMLPVRQNTRWRLPDPFGSPNYSTHHLAANRWLSPSSPLGFLRGKRESTYHSISQKRNSELQMLSHCRETTQTTKKQYMVYMQYMYTYKLFLKHIQTPSNTHTQTWSILVTQSPLPRYMNPAFALDLLLPFRWAPVFCETFGVMRSSSHRLGLNGCYYSLKPERILSWLELMIMLGFWIPKKCVESEEWEVPQAYHQGALHYPSILGFASDCNTP